MAMTDEDLEKERAARASAPPPPPPPTTGGWAGGLGASAELAVSGQGRPPPPPPPAPGLSAPRLNADGTPDPGDATRDVALARSATTGLLDKYDTAAPRVAPQASGTGATQVRVAGPTAVGPAAQTQATNVGQAATAVAGRAAAPNTVLSRDVVQAPQVQGRMIEDVQVAATERAKAVNATAATVAPAAQAAAERAQAAQVQAAAQAQTERAQAAQVDAGQQAQVRAGQLRLLGSLEGAADGTGPSAAQAQMQKATDQAISAQRAMAAGAHGTGRVTAGLTAATNVGNITQKAAADSAILRAQEQQAARGQLLQGYEGTRGADIGLATTQANLQQQVGLQNAQLGTGTSQFNTGQTNQAAQLQANLTQQAALQNAQLATGVSQSNAGETNQGSRLQANLSNQAALQNASLETGTSQFNAGQSNDRSAQQAALTMAEREANQRVGMQADLANQGVAAQAGLANAANDLSAQQSNLGANTTISTSNAALENATNLSNAQAQNRMTELQAQISSQQGIANTAQQNELTKLQAQISNSTEQFNAGQLNEGANSDARLGTQVNLANMDAELRSRGLDDQQRQSLLNAYLTSQGQSLGWDTAALGGEAAKRAQTMQLVGAGLSTGATILATPGLFGGSPGSAPGATATPDGPAGTTAGSAGDSSGGYGGTGLGNGGGLAPPSGINTYAGAGGAQTGAGPGIGPGSDERIKRDIKPLDRKALLAQHEQGGDDEVEKLLSQLQPYKFKYKDPGSDGAAPGQRYGIMAQDLEKSPMGKSIVVEDQGVKKIDPSQAVGVLLAAMSRMNEKMKAQKGKR